MQTNPEMPSELGTAKHRLERALEALRVVKDWKNPTDQEHDSVKGALRDVEEAVDVLGFVWWRSAMAGSSIR
jgi:hypothetical protein